MALTSEDLQAIGTLIENKLQPIREELQESIRHLDVKVENSFDKIYNLLKEDYAPVAEVARQTKDKVADYDELKETVSVLQEASQQHNERISVLENKQAI